MDLSSFYSVISGINFTLLGLWWVAARERAELRDAAGRRTAYLVSLGFVIPGTIALLSQVAPNVPALWRGSFAIAGVAGAVGMFLLAGAMGTSLVAQLIRFAAVPFYLLVALVALVPGITSSLDLTALQVEAILLSLLVFLGVQAAWAVAMTPRAQVDQDAGSSDTPSNRNLSS
ncbi:MAG TPA: hypothetical protein DGT23_35915 [Micromonosporaceae bacterium]|nr:hypothetical protein [Micromonosporaceae bacterium]